MSQLQLPTVQEVPKGEGSTDLVRQRIIEKLRRKFFPLERSPPPPFFEDIFKLVADTCSLPSLPTCKMDHVINLLEKASVARRDSDRDHDRTPLSDPGAAIPPASHQIGPNESSDRHRR